MTLKEMTEKQQALLTQMDAMSEAGEDDFDQEAFDAAKEEFDQLERDIAAERRRADIAARKQTLEQSAGRKTLPRITGGDRTDEFKKTGGFLDLADFARAVRSAGPGKPLDDKLNEWVKAAPSSYHQEAVGADGGYTVPPMYADMIWEVAYDDAQILGFVDPMPTASNNVTVTTDESTPWGTTGVVAYWRAEAAQMSASKSSFKENDIKLHELYAFVLATEELLSDAPRLEAHLTKKAGEAIAYKASDAIVNGNGVGQPLGWFGHACEVSQSGVASENDVISATDVVKMFGRQLDVMNAVWFINPDAFNQLPLMTIGDQPVWIPPGAGLAQAPGGTLLGRPVRFAEQCQTLGNKGDIQFVSPRGYNALAKRGGPSFASSIHLYFDYAIQAFRWTFRLGGQPYMTAAVTPPNSSVTRSHFVQLAARAG